MVPLRGREWLKQFLLERRSTELERRSTELGHRFTEHEHPVRTNFFVLTAKKCLLVWAMHRNVRLPRTTLRF